MNTQIIVAHVKHPPTGYFCIRCDRASALGNPYGFKDEAYRNLSIQLYRRWLWENIKLYKSIESIGIDTLDPFALIELIELAEKIFIAPKFKNPSVRQVIQELERISQITNPRALLCWCKGNPVATDKPCHCDVIKSCLEKLW